MEVENTQYEIQQKHVFEKIEVELHHKTVESDIQKQFLRAIFERVEDYAIFTLDSSGFITSWALGCYKIKQYSADDVIGKHFSMLYTKEGVLRNDPMNHLEIAKREGKFRGEGMRLKKNGDFFLADVLIVPMYEEDNLVGFFKIVSDLTERNKMMQERDFMSAKVDTLNIESELRDRFIYMLVHDLRNPLTAIKMCVQLIQRSVCNDSKHNELATKSVKHLRRIDQMITNLLDASRLKEGEPFPIKKEYCNLTEIVKETVEEFATVYGERFDLNIESPAMGNVDAKAFKRVVENLITNAIKYGDPYENIAVGLSLHSNHMYFRVHNHGAPISEVDRESLFNIFSRLDLAVKSKTKGWGLGLTLVRGITEAHNGSVKVTSIPKEGTTFVVDWPI